MPHPAKTTSQHGRQNTSRKDEIVQVRASARTKAMLNQAASLRGQKLSEFVLDSARRQAEETILDQRAFLLDPQAHERFLAILDAPTTLDKKLRALLTRKAAWES